MAASRNQINSKKAIDVSQLLRLGRIAAHEGDRASAHKMLQQAAMLSPTSEQVWLELLQVVETDADRYICLQNIVSINPNNIQAKQQLERFQELAASQASPTIQTPTQKRGITLGRVLDMTLFVIEALVILLLIGLGIVLVAYV